MLQGYIKLHRKIRDWYGYQNPYRLSLWLHLLMDANHKDKKFLFNGEPTVVKRGQTLTGRKKLSLETGISESYVEKLLKEFEKEGMLEQQTSNRNRLISIVCYDQYQGWDNQEDNGETTERQPRDTNNNDNNDKNVNKGRFKPPTKDEFNTYIKDKGFEVEFDRFSDFYESKGWMVGKNKMKDWKAAVRTWARNNQPVKTQGRKYAEL